MLQKIMLFSSWLKDMKKTIKQINLLLLHFVAFCLFEVQTEHSNSEFGLAAIKPKS